MKKILKNENIFQSELLNPNNVTGKAMFQFDDDEPIQLVELYDDRNLTFLLEVPEKQEIIKNEFSVGIKLTRPSSIEFHNKDNTKRFKIFVERTHKEKELLLEENK